MRPTIVVICAVIALCSFVKPAYADTPSLEDACKKSGGSVVGFGCYCEKIKIYVNPWVQTCSLAIPGWAIPDGSKTCQVGGADAPISVVRERAFNRKDLCANPIKYVCDPELNPAIGRVDRARDSLDAMETDAQRSEEVRKFIKKHGAGKASTCVDLELDDFAECKEMIREKIEPQVYTKNRRAIAQKIFEKAKDNILLSVQRHRSYLQRMVRGAKIEGEKKIWQLRADTAGEMLEKLEEAQLYLGRGRDLESQLKLQYNAFASKMKPESQIGVWDELWGNTRRNTIYLQGMILLADASPESLYRVLLHELSHFVDPGAMPGRAPYLFDLTNTHVFNPYFNAINCLKRPDTMGIKMGDAKCFENLAAKNKNPFTEGIYSNIAKDIREDPYATTASPIYSDGDSPCQLGQMTEGFADWLATEVYGESGGFDGSYFTYVPQRVGDDVYLSDIGSWKKIGGWAGAFCSSYQREKSAGETREGNKDSHPIYADRIAGGYLAHPVIKSALGCGTSDIRTIKNVYEPVDGSNPGYCSAHEGGAK